MYFWIKVSNSIAGLQTICNKISCKWCTEPPKLLLLCAWVILYSIPVFQNNNLTKSLVLFKFLELVTDITLYSAHYLSTNTWFTICKSNILFHMFRIEIFSTSEPYTRKECSFSEIINLCSHQKILGKRWGKNSSL